MSRHGSRCVYCGRRAVGGAYICDHCYEKLMVVRKLRAILMQIQKEAEGNESHDDDDVGR